MPASVVGRDAELAVIDDFLAAIAEGAKALVLDGEAGMGKTTLWRAGIEEGRAAGHRVLRAEPTETETALSFSALGDLLDPVLDEALEPLPAGQRSALARALVLEDDDGPAPDAHAAGVALLNVLRALAGPRPVLVAVDDVQWLDTASAGALAYATRRLREERVGVLLARRAGLESGVVDDLGRTAGLVTLDVGPLDPSSLHRVVEAHLGASLPRPLLAEVHQASGGNPFYALEIVRTLSRSGVSVAAGRPLPVPDSLHGLVHGRLLALPESTRHFLAAAAAHAHPTVAITEQACGVERGDGLGPALAARVVETDGDRIRFTHPLLAAGALETADPRRRTEIHARLAELLEDPEARAWQLAASGRAPDDAVAAVIEDAADHAKRRGAPRPAALLLDCAEQLTPAGSREDAVRRAVEAAQLHFEAGDSRRAESKLDDVIASLPSGPLRARALVVLARIRLYEAPDEARDLFAQVIAEAGDDAQTLALAHEGSAACGIWTFQRFDEALQHVEIALALAAEVGDEALAADTLLAKLGVETLLGRPTIETARRAAALQERSIHARVLDQPLLALAESWAWTDEHERARAALLELLGRADELGDESARPYLLLMLGQLEVTVGELEAGLERALEAREAADQTGLPLFRERARVLEALAQAQLGRAEAARAAAAPALDGEDDRLAALVASTALALLDLSLGQPGDAAERLASPVAFVRVEGVVEPGAARFVSDYVEALVEVGRTDEAVEVLGWHEANASRLERISALASCARCRGLLAAQAGECEDAIAAYEEALSWHARVDVPLDRGRTLVALGAAQRRLKRRREARATLEEALGVFEGIGAALWAERARAELKRISGRAATPGALTPAEERVAALVAEGKTNKEVAAALFLSDRTVEGHLAHVFGKLGIRHRTELARALQTQGIAPSNTGDSPVSAEPAAP
jgi:DNA-binding CsgD family transcriptional regulator